MHIVHQLSEQEFLVIGVYFDTHVPKSPQAHSFLAGFDWESIGDDDL